MLKTKRTYFYYKYSEKEFRKRFPEIKGTILCIDETYLVPGVKITAYDKEEKR